MAQGSCGLRGLAGLAPSFFNAMPSPFPPSLAPAPRAWTVAALCKAAADLLEARLNPVAVAGEIVSFTRAASGHCYFTLKDETAQLRCVLFRRGAGLMNFEPREGDRVEARGRLAIYEARGDLQLIVESLRRADGRGAWYEQFLRLKAQLDAQGLFDPARNRPLPGLPRSIGVVTSLGAAALSDVVTALRRRAPHVPVIVAPSSVQGPQAPADLVAALRALYGRVAGIEGQAPPIDVILLVRGGGAPEELATFNDEILARTIAASPVPLVTGIGHETDFTIADFCADLRAATPTAAAELVARPREDDLAGLERIDRRLRQAVRHRLDGEAMRLDHAATRGARPAAVLRREAERLLGLCHRLQGGVRQALLRGRERLRESPGRLAHGVQRQLDLAQARLAREQIRLDLLDPSQVLRRGYAWLEDAGGGEVIASVRQARPGQQVHARLADGSLALAVQTVQVAGDKPTGRQSS